MSKTEKFAELVGASLAVVVVSLVLGLIGSVALMILVGGLHDWVSVVPGIGFNESLKIVFGTGSLVLLLGAVVKAVAN